MLDVTESLQQALTGRYRIDRPLGKGGMATVYLAQDLKHGRDVAIKVLDPELAVTLGAERFLSEIRTTARLQHPHILPLLDSGDAGGGLLYYVMPVVTGESLRARLQRDVQLPVDDALRVATQVAEALDYAHRQDVVHRDIKPENILLHDDQALVADFGIALALRYADTESRLTGTGISVGTPHYMSPEQAAGDRVQTTRTDIYALGAVLHEMLCGEPPFTGPTPQTVIAKTMSQKPTPIRVLRDSVPDHVETAVLRALQKVPADRFGTAAEFAHALRGNASAATSRRSLPRRWPLAAVALVVLAAIAAWAISSAAPGAPNAATTARVTVPVARGYRLPTASALYPLNISPDGHTLVYVAERDGVRRLLVRQLAEFRETELPGTEDATHPAVSGDGRWIAYFARGRLSKVSVGGGEPIPLAEASGSGGAFWFGDSLLFAAGGRLFTVSASGGTATHVGSARMDSAYSRSYSLRGVRWPQLLPGGKHILLVAGDSVAVMNRQTGSLAMLLQGDQPSYLTSGHLVFSAGEGRVRVAPFDLSKLAVTGAPEPVFEAFRGPGSGANYFAVSSSGTLVYVPGGFDRALTIVDRNGRETAVPAPRRGYRFPRVSPDGRRAAITIDPRPSKTWIVDLRTGALAPVAASGAYSEQHQLHPVWSPDGREVAYGRIRGIDVATVDGTPGVRSAFTDSTTSALVPSVWLPSGQLLGHTYGSAGSDIVTFRIGDSAFTRLVATDALETQAAVSPDSRWLAYASDASGAREVYVRPYPGPGAAVAVTTSGGVEPRWARNGSELYYRNGQDIWAVTVRPGPRPSFGQPRRLFGGPYDFQQDDNWDVVPDGRFLMIMADPNAATQFLLVLNWFEELRARFRRGT